MDRRDFLKTSAIVGCGALVASQLDFAHGLLARVEAGELTKEEAYRLAIMAQAGLARTIRPAHSPVDGDTMFALTTGRNHEQTDLLQLGTLAARTVERAIVRAVTSATGLAGVPSAGEWMAER